MHLLALACLLALGTRCNQAASRNGLNALHLIVPTHLRASVWADGRGLRCGGEPRVERRVKEGIAIILSLSLFPSLARIAPFLLLAS